MLLRLIESFKIFDIIFSLTGGGPGTATEVYPSTSIELDCVFLIFGYASALSYLLLAIVMVVVNLFFRMNSAGLRVKEEKNGSSKKEISVFSFIRYVLVVIVVCLGTIFALLGCVTL